MTYYPPDDPDYYPALVCDVCGATKSLPRTEIPQWWLRNNKPLPGWKMTMVDGKRRDICWTCKKAGRE